MFCKSSINQITNPKPIYSHTHTGDNIFNFLIIPHISIAISVSSLLPDFLWDYKLVFYLHIIKCVVTDLNILQYLTEIG
jgi:hypothetical protein